MSNLRSAALAAVVLCLSWLVVPGAAAADYPTRPIHLVSPYTPGGGNDISARILAEALTARLGQAVIVENRAGAGGLIGTDHVAKSAPDGYTLLFASGETITMLPALKKSTPYRVPEDFTYIARTNENGMTLAINASLPVKSMAEFIAYAKAHPGVVTYGTNGVGAAPHLAVALFMKQTGIRMQHVPYKGIANAMTDMLGGQIDLVPLTPVTIFPYLHSPQLRIIGFTGAERHPMIPDVPTLTELGIPHAVVTVWYSLLGPANLPPAVTERLQKEVAASLADPVVRAKLEKLGSTVSPVYGADFEKSVVDEYHQWQEIAREDNLVLE